MGISVKFELFSFNNGTPQQHSASAKGAAGGAVAVDEASGELVEDRLLVAPLRERRVVEA